MRFVVDILRIFLIAAIGLVIIGATFFAVGTPDMQAFGLSRAYTIAIAAFIALFFVLNLSLIAVMISVHDSIARIADAVEQGKINHDQGS